MIKQLSISQITTFDPTQKGGCPRRWWFEALNGLKPDQSDAQSDGTKGHALYEAYFPTGTMPPKRAKMSKAVTGSIVKGQLPKPGPDLLVERRFSGQKKYGVECECGHVLVGHDDGGRCTEHGCTCAEAKPAWIPLDVSKTLHVGGVPFEGFTDLAYRRGEIPVCIDHKFSVAVAQDGSTIRERAIAGEQLINTVQMPITVLAHLTLWPDAKQWRIAHNNVARQGVDSFIRSAVVSVDQVREREAAIVKVIDRMKVVSEIPAQNQDHVPANNAGPGRACESWGGCPHQSICNAFKNPLKTGAAKMELSAEELAMFGESSSISATPTPAQVSAPADSTAPKARRMQFQDATPTPPAPVPAVPAPAPEVAPSATCACSATITPENGSRLQSGEWKHIGCPLVAVLPPDAPTSKPQLASEQPPAPAEIKPPKATRKPKAEAPQATMFVQTPDLPAQAHTVITYAPAPPPIAATVPELAGSPRALAVADVLESIARLIRAS